MDLILFAAIPGLSCGVAVALFTGKAQRAQSAFLLVELLWLLALALVSVVPAHGIQPTPQPRPACIDRAEFVDSVPRIDAIAGQLKWMSATAATKTDGETLAEASELLKLSIRLLALSEWACK